VSKKHVGFAFGLVCPDVVYGSVGVLLEIGRCATEFETVSGVVKEKNSVNIPVFVFL
jgi:hypothetical protein